MDGMSFRVLMVCTGNICRSTMAQEVLSEAARGDGLGVVVDSAGISDEERGNPIDRRAARVLREAGHAVPDHRARQVAADELGRWDLVLAMTQWHLASLRRLARRAGIEDVRDPAPGDPAATDLRMYRAMGPDELLRRAAAAAQGGSRPASQVLAGQGEDGLDVPDPWYGGHEEFVETLQCIEGVTPGIIEHIRALVGAREAPRR